MKIKQNANGFLTLEGFFILFLIGGAVYYFFLRDDTAMIAETTPEVVVTSQESTTSEAISNMPLIVSLQPVNGYSGSGRVSRTFEFGKPFILSISAGLPNNFETTFYEAWLENSAGQRMYLGKMTKSGATFKLDFETRENLTTFSNIIISVDGDATTVEGRSLPHDVMRGSF